METGAAVSVKINAIRLSLEFGLKSRKPAGKPHLTQAMRKKRLKFAKRHDSWDMDIEIQTFLFQQKHPHFGIS